MLVLSETRSGEPRQNGSLTRQWTFCQIELLSWETLVPNMVIIFADDTCDGWYQAPTFLAMVVPWIHGCFIKKKEGRKLNELKSKHDGEGGTRLRKANLSWSTMVHVILEANLKDLCMPLDEVLSRFNAMDVTKQQLLV